MTPIRAVIVTMAFALVVWAAGRALTALAARNPSCRTRQYLAGRVDRLRIAAVVAYEDELLVTLAADVHPELAARAWRVAADASARTRLERWLDDATPLRAYRSADGAIMLADPVWGGNVACEPALAVG
ncbi:MAG: hypothetical protein ACYCO3_10675 [Mycobacteriales bacterium]